MISLIVPTYNRAYALKQVLDTFFTQEKVNEIVFIDDASSDDTSDVVQAFVTKYPTIKVVYHRNLKKSGASFSRLKGVELATNEYILFCDDDEFIGNSYARICLEKILSGKADIASGRHFYRDVNENYVDAIKRFKVGLKHGTVFRKICFKLDTDTIFYGDIFVPFTHGIFLTSKKLLLTYPIDPFYSKGNGFREESDFQVNAFLHNNKVLISNDCHCVHMNMKEVKTGGQRVNRLVRFYWSILYTHYFLKKYYEGLRTKLGIPYPFFVAMILYIGCEFYNFFLRPFVILARKL